LGGLLTHLLFRRHPLSRATLRVIFLVGLTIVLVHAGVVPYEPQTRTGVPFQDAVYAALKIAWWLWAAWFVVGFLRAFVVTERRPRAGKLVQDLLAGLIYRFTAPGFSRSSLRSSICRYRAFLRLRVPSRLFLDWRCKAR